MQNPSTDIVLRLRSALAAKHVGASGMETLARDAANAILDLRCELAQAKTAIKATEPAKPADSQKEIEAIGQEIISMLLEKNRKYGDSALRPLRVFSSTNNIEQIKIRIDDKLSRIASAQTDEDEDVLVDLIGYLMLLLVAKRKSA